MDYVAYEETHHGIRIRIISDPHASNPYGDMDGLAPLVAYGYDRAGTSTHGGGDDIGDPLDLLDDVRAMELAHAFLDILGCDRRAWHEALTEEAHRYGHPFPFPSDFALMLRTTFDEQLRTIKESGRDDLEKRAALYRAAGIPAHVITRHGYCQGDTLELLLVHLPAWREKTGAPAYDTTSDDPEKNGRRDMQGDADTYAAWAFGDVYGYVLSTRDEDADEDDDDAWTDVDEDGSCWGFYARYGSDEWEHMLSEARAAAEELASPTTALAA